jgi:hypothetical protein
MAFERARIVIKQASVGTGIKVSLAAIRGADAKMKFSITPELAKTFGCSDGDKLEVLLGTESDHGLIRMRKNNSVGEATVSFRKGPHATKYVQVALGHQPMFVNRAEPARWVQSEQIEDGYVEIVMPRWADETGPKRRSVADAVIKPQALQPKQNVTSMLMGDPPPNRREMLAKIGDVKA